ncbi:PAAR domain-containing protein [Enterobacter bugandensis]|uniref:PAAR domain-containing protein n=1 Tax=Enterobacter bugandensis TaxID=881260 RepID=UPI002D7787BA|nr:PAAR domain-containing protein [Enterobacter bugandensis]WRT51851.1 PAAR domain-containing protein [Enterobacter bugandensis]
MASVNRGCTVHGKNVGLHGDKTSTGAQCIAARPGMSVMGLWKLYIGDKTTPCPICGKVGVIVSGDPRCSNSAAVAVDGAEILCGCPQGTNFLIAPGTIEVNTPSWATAPVEPVQHAQATKKPNTFADTCKPEDNPLLNGVYIWTETTETGHAFVSVHENNTVYLYTYGRYGRTGGPFGMTGDGILDFMKGDDARDYYRKELYENNARVFKINDAGIPETRAFFENLWQEGRKPIGIEENSATARTGHSIDSYDVTGSNCTTHTVAGIKAAGSSIFDTSYRSTSTQLPIESEEHFTIPISLQSYLLNKSRSLQSMAVVEVTDEFKNLYSNVNGQHVSPEGMAGKAKRYAAKTMSSIGSISPYSGENVGGILGDYDE